MLNVTVLGSTYYRGPAFNGFHIVSDIKSSSGPVYEYPIVVSDIVYFTVQGEPSYSSAPSPTPSPAASSSSERTLSSDPNFTSYTGLALLIIVVAAAMFSGLLLYFKKRTH